MVPIVTRLPRLRNFTCLVLVGRRPRVEVTINVPQLVQRMRDVNPSLRKVRFSPSELWIIHDQGLVTSKNVMDYA